MVSFRVFSTLKIIKVDKRSSLGNDLLDDLLVVSLKDFNLDHSISLWSSEKTRRPNQGPGRNIANIEKKMLNNQKMVTKLASSLMSWIIGLTLISAL